MNIRVIKVDMAGVEQQLSRIADMLEHLIYATNPPEQYMAGPSNNPNDHVFYTDDVREIIDYKLREAGLERHIKD
jgi:hypothetical protein